MTNEALWLKETRERLVLVIKRAERAEVERDKWEEAARLSYRTYQDAIGLADERRLKLLSVKRECARLGKAADALAQACGHVYSKTAPNCKRLVDSAWVHGIDDALALYHAARSAT